MIQHLAIQHLAILGLAFGGAVGSMAGPVSATAPVPRDKVLLTVDEALALAFPKAKIERGRVFLTEAQKKRAAGLAKAKVEQGIVRPYVARDEEGKLLGTAYLDTHQVRTLKETVLVVVGPDERLLRIELLSFGEPTNYIPRGNWYGQFKGKKLDDQLNLKRGIKGVTGATLTARATTEAARRVLALHHVVNTKEPPPKEGGTGGGRR